MGWKLIETFTASLRDEETNLDGFEDSKPVSPLLQELFHVPLQREADQEIIRSNRWPRKLFRFNNLALFLPYL